MGGFHDINNDLLMKVISSLPTKTLSRFKSVSKLWFQIISDRLFIKSHLKTIENEQVCGFFFQERFQYIDEDIHFNSFISIDSDVLRQKVLHNVFSFLPEDVTVQSVANGLVCCRSLLPCHDPYIYVCNPVNKEWVTFRCDSPVNRLNTFALAFDPVQDFIHNSTHFKVVRVHQTTVADEDEQPCYLFEIYYSKTREWRVIRELCLRKEESLFNNAVWINGILYWLAGDQVLTFNVNYELPWLVCAPIPTSELGAVAEICIGEYKGHLHYVILSAYGLQVWSLEEIYEAKWVIKFSTTLDQLENENRKLFYKVAERVSQRVLSWITLLAFRDGLVLMRVSDRVLMYNVKTRLVEEPCSLSVLGSKTYFGPLVVPYTMSLVPFL